MAKILVAEDERDIRDLISFTLRFAGHEVVTANNGEEALESTLSEKPDLILMDVRMPRMTGYEARWRTEGRWARKISRWCSSRPRARKPKSRRADAGAVEYILKPFPLTSSPPRAWVIS
jgi:CheY-like chemotaxis protein